MAKTSMIERQKKRQRMVAQYAAKRAALKAVADDAERPMDERFRARLKLAKLPRNSSATRLKNRCLVTGPAALLLPQAQDEPHRAARPRLVRPGAGHGQVELVRSTRCR